MSQIQRFEPVSFAITIVAITASFFLTHWLYRKMIRDPFDTDFKPFFAMVLIAYFVVSRGVLFFGSLFSPWLILILLLGGFVIFISTRFWSLVTDADWAIISAFAIASYTGIECGLRILARPLFAHLYPG